MKWLTCLLMLICSNIVEAQNRSSVWCFGDSAGIDFSNINNPQPITSALRTRGSCCSISDTSGNLLFYANTRAGIVGNTTLVWNWNHQLMQGGDSIVGEGWYYELTIVPSPSNDNTYYLFTVGVTPSGDQGFYYTKIDMNLNGGLGAITQKNVMLLSYPSSDGVAAIKHGNGRDWWILFRRGGLPTNEFYFFLVTPTGIQGPFIYSIGSISNSNILRPIFSSDGSKILIVNWAGLVEIFDFDRCSGTPSNPLTIEPENCCPNYFTAEFSPNNRVLYIGTEQLDSCHILQYDLTAPDILASRDTIYSFTYPPSYAPLGLFKRAPDEKIYVANGYYNGVQNFYPYADSMYNSYNMYISVINSPDSLGDLCDFQPYSFYLGGRRSYLGLPNNPTYELGPLTGSACDSIVDIYEEKIQNTITVFPNPANDFLNIHSDTDIQDLKVYNQLGILVNHISSAGNRITTSSLSPGLYFLQLQSTSGVQSVKFIKK